MNIRFLVGLILIFGSSWSMACDICGGFVINPRTGLISQVNRDFISLAYSHIRFDGRDLSYEKDVFQTYQASGQYQLSKRWGVGFVQSYAFNRRSENEGINIDHDGWGNTVIQVFYAPVQRMKDNGVFSWRTGGGIRLPYGTFDENIHDLNVPENFNPSDGSWGFQWSNDLVYTQNKWGLQFISTTIFRGEDPTGGRLGQQVSAQLTGFRYWDLNDRWTLAPMVGATLEGMTHNRLVSGRNDLDTGGTIGLLQAGLALNQDQWSINVQVLEPFYTQWNGEGVQPGTRIILSTTYFIN